jgi:spectinomycin phosphotransferase
VARADEVLDDCPPALRGWEWHYLKRLCHADLHTWNVLVDSDQQLWIVDWDEAVVAPRERDLMFVVGGICAGLVSPDDTRAFFQGYGRARVDPVLLAYYRCAWAVQDIAAYAEEAVLSPGLGASIRRAALEGFVSLFEPGNIVDLASAIAPAGRPGS